MTDVWLLDEMIVGISNLVALIQFLSQYYKIIEANCGQKNFDFPYDNT